MRILVGLLLSAGAIGLFLSRERFLTANKASTAALFGRADPHGVAPRLTRVWNLAIVTVVCMVLLVVGVLLLLKTHGPWRYRVTSPGVYEWTSPHGYRFRRDRTGTTADPPDG